MIERLFLHEHIKECRFNPENCLMVYLDGMDQQKTHIPQLNKQETKGYDLLGMRYKDATIIMACVRRLIGGLTFGGTKEDQGFGFFSLVTDSLLTPTVILSVCDESSNISKMIVRDRCLQPYISNWIILPKIIKIWHS